MGRRSCRSMRLVVVVAAVLVAAALGGSSSLAVAANLQDDWDVQWAPENVKFSQDGSGMALSVASSSSTGCNIRTKKTFIYGSISGQIKLVPGDSAGVVTTLYADSEGIAGAKHEEIDFEFIGNVAGQPYTIHTNLFAADVGGREVEFTPWFDPTADYHNYTISWSSCMVVWYVDDTPIRAYRNYEASHGVPYPTTQPMYGAASIWETDGAWATHGGQVKTDWSKAPFVSDYQRVSLDVCAAGTTNCPYGGEVSSCGGLSPAQAQQLRDVQGKHKSYDYCDDKGRFNGQMPPECALPQY